MNDRTVVHIIDDDAAMRDSLAFLLDVNGFKPLVYDSASALLAASPIDALSCVVSISAVREIRVRAGFNAPAAALVVEAAMTWRGGATRHPMPRNPL